MTPAGFRKLFAGLGEAAKFPFPVHPHMLRHECGYKLANDGRDTQALQHFMGHVWTSGNRGSVQEADSSAIRVILARLQGLSEPRYDPLCWTGRLPENDGNLHC